MAVKITGGGIGVFTPADAKATNYAHHLGKPDVVKAKQVQGGVQIQSGGKTALTAVPVHASVIDGGCKVGCMGGRTIATAPYENVKVQVWLEMPCSKDTIGETFEFVSDWVGQQLEQAVKGTK